MKRFDSHKILVNHYEKQIQADFNWNKVKHEILSNCQVQDDQIVGLCFLGTIFGLTPSGKVYAFWTTNQNSSDIRRDQAFNEALNNIAAKHGLFVDYLDDNIFVGQVVDINNVLSFVTSEDQKLAQELTERS